MESDFRDPENRTPDWIRAGRYASEHSAHHEAAAHLTRGLELLTSLPSTPDLLQQELPFEFIKVHHDPDGNFPNGVPNPASAVIAGRWRTWPGDT